MKVTRFALCICLSSAAVSAFLAPHVKPTQRMVTVEGVRPTVFGNVLKAEPEAAAVEEASPVELEKAPEPEPVAEEPAAAEEEAEKEEKVRNTVFVGNIPFVATDAELRDLFADVGTVEMVSVPRNRETGQARGFAFVDMSSPEEVEKAVEALHEVNFGGRTIRVTPSLPKDQVKQQPKKRDAIAEGMKKIYIGNLPFDASAEDIMDFYGEFGPVQDLYMPINTSTGTPRGFAFISMKEDDALTAIEETNGIEFMGRRLAVSEPLPPGEKVKRERTKDEVRTKLYVGNLSFYTVADTLRELFEEFGTVHDCYMPADQQTGGSRGFGFVTMEPEDAMSAINETDGCELDGRIIRVNEAQPKRSRQDFVDEETDDFSDEE